MFIAVPTMGSVRVELIEFISSEDWGGVFYSNQLTPHATARNTLVEGFLKSGLEWLFFIDSDTVPPPNTLDEFSKYKDDKVMTGITPIIRGDKLCQNIFIETTDVVNPKPMDQKHIPSSPVIVVGCGASCLLIHKDVLQSMTFPYFRSIEFENGGYCSEDLYFCEKVRDAGYRILAVPEVICSHYKTIAL